MIEGGRVNFPMKNDTQRDFDSLWVKIDKKARKKAKNKAQEDARQSGKGAGGEIFFNRMRRSELSTKNDVKS